MKRFLIPVLILTAVNAVAAGRSRAIRVPHGQPTAWTAPNCTTTYGLPGFYFTRDEGKTVSVNAHPLPVNTSLFVVATDVPNRMFAILGDDLYDSSDAGCNWSLRARVPFGPTSMIAAPGGRAYAWSYAEGRILRISVSSFDAVELPGRTMGFGVDPADAKHVVAVTKSRVHESYDSGSSWSDRELFAYPMIDAAAVDPTDIRHIAVFYVALAGAVPRVKVSRDGGATWQRDTEGVRAWNLAFSPVDPNAIWMSGLAWPPVGAGRLNAYQSADGGMTFKTCLVPSSNLLLNNLTLAPSPFDPHVAAQASSSGGLVMFDAASKTMRFAPGLDWHSVLWSPVPGIIYLSASQTIIHDPYTKKGASEDAPW